MPKKKKKDRPIFKGRSHKSFLNQCRLKLVTLPFRVLFKPKLLLDRLNDRQVPNFIVVLGYCSIRAEPTRVSDVDKTHLSPSKTIRIKFINLLGCTQVINKVQQDEELISTIHQIIIDLTESIMVVIPSSIDQRIDNFLDTRIGVIDIPRSV